jgi:Tfp pilus assembly protein PilF
MKRHHTITILLALTAVFAFQFTWADEVPADYQMSVVLDRAYGGVVSRGDFDKAILRINTHRSRFPYATATNLCVAQTMVGQYKHAEHYCDKALEEAEKAAAKGRRKSRDCTAEWALAYSNRGVLRARRGDNAGAEKDFRMAIEKQSQSELPIHNLARLSGETAAYLAQDKDFDIELNEKD